MEPRCTLVAEDGGALIAAAIQHADLIRERVRRDLEADLDAA